MFLKFLNKKEKPVKVEPYVIRSEKTEWKLYDSKALNTFLSSDTGMKLLNVLNDSIICKKTEPARGKDVEAILYEAGFGDGMIALLMKIRSMSVAPEEDKYTDAE